ncbi:MAG: M23 family metallopeptidase [Anaerolineae bacterium]|nr:M23 family metallopeptidase [Anaerolineae bacterium]MCZ7552255.1 M23 family metallopeptidase [Anaerolineales bacterium]
MARVFALLAGAALVGAGCMTSGLAPSQPTLEPSNAVSPTAPAPTDECPEDQSASEICVPGNLRPSETSQPPPGPTDAPIATTAAPPSPIAAPTTPPTPAAAGAEIVCQDETCRYGGLLFLRRPIDPPANDQIDLSYPFGSTQSGMRDPHHGVEFLNAYGTPVLAAADGTVVVAGTDLDPTSAHGEWPITYYGPYSNFYGNLIVIEHELPQALRKAFPALSGPFYTLYGHLSAIEVAPGEAVAAGQAIGKVGMAGIATGSHLHLEVRIGENSYQAAHNPALWLAPQPGKDGQLSGALVGSFFDHFGNSLEMDSIVLEHLPGGADEPSDFQVSTRTYQEKGLRGQPPFEESFGLGDLPAGLYRITFALGGLRQELVQIFPAQITVFTFRLDN